MSESAAVSTPILLPVVQFAPSDIVRRRIAAWNGIRTDAVEVVRREPFQAGFKAPCHLLIMCERAERDDGETLVEGLPRSTLQEFSLTRVTYFYIDPRGPLIDPELRFAESEFMPRLFFFDHDLWETALKLKPQAVNPDAGQKQYVEALSVVLMHELLRLNNGASRAKRRFAAALPAGKRGKWPNTSNNTSRRTSRWRHWPTSQD